MDHHFLSSTPSVRGYSIGHEQVLASSLTSGGSVFVSPSTPLFLVLLPRTARWEETLRGYNMAHGFAQQVAVRGSIAAIQIAPRVDE
jgi:hypothetical protein